MSFIRVCIEAISRRITTTSDSDAPSLKWRLLAEFYATAFMVFVGNAACAQALFSNGSAASSTDVNLAWGFAITFAIYSAYNVSGGHINPSISIAYWLLGKISLLDFLFYFFAQTFGAGLGSLAAYGVYREAVAEMERFPPEAPQSDPFPTASIWVSFPATHVSHTGAFIDQIAGTSFLGMFVAMTSRANSPIPAKAVPLMFGLNAIMLGSAFGLNAGCPLNPARDLGPRIVASSIGYGSVMFTHDNFYFWVPLVAPLIGSVLGALLYNLMIIDTSSHSLPNRLSKMDAEDTEESSELIEK